MNSGTWIPDQVFRKTLPAGIPVLTSKIHDIVLVRREECEGIANFVKPRMVSMGISRGFIAKSGL